MDLGGSALSLAISPSGQRLIVGGFSDSPRGLVAPRAASLRAACRASPRRSRVWHSAPTVDWSRQRAAIWMPAERLIRIWDVASGEEVTVLEVDEKPIVSSLQFTDEKHLLSVSESGLLRWDVANRRARTSVRGARSSASRRVPTEIACSWFRVTTSRSAAGVKPCCSIAGQALSGGFAISGRT